LQLVPLGTPVSAAEIGELSDQRTRIQNDVVGEDFRYVRHCAGTHIHVERWPGREGEQLNALVALDPALALVNSSSYFAGDPIAAGARSVLYRRMAYDDLPHQGRLWRYVADTDEWDRRLERRYEEFVEAALAAGADRRTVEANFDPESAIWTPVQLRDQFPTVEWRSPDAALPGQVVQLADDVATFVERLRTRELRIEGETGGVTDDAVVVPEFDAVLDYVEAAIRDGLESTALASYLDRMGFDVDAYEPTARKLSSRGHVDREEGRRIRLEHAAALERDVRGRRVPSDD